MTEVGRVSIRKLDAADSAAFRRLRLESLDQAPEAFASSMAEEAALSEDEFAARLDRNVVVGAFLDDELVGMAGFYTLERIKTRHKGHVWGVYVAPQARRIGLGRQLMDAILGHASGVVERIDLSVTATNEPACRLYESLGFETYGLEKQALRWNGRDYDELLMTRHVLPP
jgi:ribosomal protein S18 acetylase RimI-like enzyme